MPIYILLTLGIVFILIMIYVSKYNTLKRRRNQIENASSSLDALFTKRHDLIPNLVTLVKQYTDYEGEILEKIIKLRQPTKGSSEYVQGGETDQLLKQLMIQVENYPALKANQQLTNLQYAIDECEEQIAAGRRYLSASITNYNNSVMTFPSNIVANMSGMKVHEWERATMQQRENVDVKELFK